MGSEMPDYVDGIDGYVDNPIQRRRLLVRDLNECLMCTLCDGYLIDATVITICLHTFCRSCIVRYLESSHYCPTCDIQVHKSKPLTQLRTDKSLQLLLYKLIPSVYQNEVKRRADFYSNARASSSCSEDSILTDSEAHEQSVLSHINDDNHTEFFSPDDSISLSLEYYNDNDDIDNEYNNTTSSSSLVNIEKTGNLMQNGDADNQCDNTDNSTLSLSPTKTICKRESDIKDIIDSHMQNGDNSTTDNVDTDKSSNEVSNTELLSATSTSDNNENIVHKRYLQCPAGVNIKHLTKFIRMKYGLSFQHRVDIIYEDEILPKNFTLMDVAYSFKWNRSNPMRFMYRIFESTKMPLLKSIYRQQDVNITNLNNNHDNHNNNNRPKTPDTSTTNNGTTSDSNSSSKNTSPSTTIDNKSTTNNHTTKLPQSKTNSNNAVEKLSTNRLQKQKDTNQIKKQQKHVDIDEITVSDNTDNDNSEKNDNVDRLHPNNIDNTDQIEKNESPTLQQSTNDNDKSENDNNIDNDEHERILREKEREIQEFAKKRDLEWANLMRQTNNNDATNNTDNIGNDNAKEDDDDEEIPIIIKKNKKQSALSITPTKKRKKSKHSKHLGNYSSKRRKLHHHHHHHYQEQEQNDEETPTIEENNKNTDILKLKVKLTPTIHKISPTITTGTLKITNKQQIKNNSIQQQQQTKNNIQPIKKSNEFIMQKELQIKATKLQTTNINDINKQQITKDNNNIKQQQITKDNNSLKQQQQITKDNNLKQQQITKDNNLKQQQELSTKERLLQMRQVRHKITKNNSNEIQQQKKVRFNEDNNQIQQKTTATNNNSNKCNTVVPNLVAPKSFTVTMNTTNNNNSNETTNKKRKIQQQENDNDESNSKVPSLEIMLINPNNNTTTTTTTPIPIKTTTPTTTLSNNMNSGKITQQLKQQQNLKNSVQQQKQQVTINNNNTNNAGRPTTLNAMQNKILMMKNLNLTQINKTTTTATTSATSNANSVGGTITTTGVNSGMEVTKMTPNNNNKNKQIPLSKIKKLSQQQQQNNKTTTTTTMTSLIKQQQQQNGIVNNKNKIDNFGALDLSRKSPETTSKTTENNNKQQIKIEDVQKIVQNKQHLTNLHMLSESAVHIRDLMVSAQNRNMTSSQNSPTSVTIKNNSKQLIQTKKDYNTMLTNVLSQQKQLKSVSPSGNNSNNSSSPGGINKINNLINKKTNEIKTSTNHMMVTGTTLSPSSPRPPGVGINSNNTTLRIPALQNHNKLLQMRNLQKLPPKLQEISKSPSNTSTTSTPHSFPNQIRPNQTVRNIPNPSAALLARHHAQAVQAMNNNSSSSTVASNTTSMSTTPSFSAPIVSNALSQTTSKLSTSTTGTIAQGTVTPSLTSEVKISAPSENKKIYDLKTPLKNGTTQNPTVKITQCDFSRSTTLTGVVNTASVSATATTSVVASTATPTTTIASSSVTANVTTTEVSATKKIDSIISTAT